MKRSPFGGRWLRAFGAGLVFAAGVLAPARPAAAHTGDASGPTNFETVIRDVEPQVDGLRFRSVDLSNAIELRNRSGKEVVVYGYEDEPYLRINDDGVFENERSPATYLNASRDGDSDIPPEADPDAKPKWRKVSSGDTVQWHDHRSHWMASDDPPAVRNDPSRRHVVLPEWSIPFTVADEAGSVTGELTWTPGPDARPYWLGAAVLAAAVIGAMWFARRRRRPLLAALLVLAVAASLWQTLGLVLAPDQSGPPLARFAEGATLLILGWGGGLIGAWWLRSHRAGDAAPLVGFAGLALLFVGGIADASAFSRAHVGFAWGDDLGRVAVVASLGLGAGLTVVAALTAKLRWFGRMTSS